ncbi:Ig domain-containing protein [Leptospira barantonii]|uniref:Uncharacterized protein n=1 Tax=Leptospira barantonii TaxID=2023184 RepID=A0ABX4NFM1_9LEPT|nr:Ig domain-containing protein [Leptospira barantonii]PJZ55605.1 hypothetical protein CH367_19210 [Leptospira barantonii]
MKKSILALLLFSSIFISCDDEKKKQDDNVTLLLLQQLSTLCPSSITMISSNTTINAQVGSAIPSIGIHFTSPSASETQLLANKNCKFDNFTLTSTLPAGLSFNSSTGNVTGTPTAQGGPTAITFTASVTANGGAPVTVTGAKSIKVLAAGVLTCSSVGFAGGCTTKPYSCTNSSFCYSTMSGCLSASECGY